VQINVRGQVSPVAILGVVVVRAKRKSRIRAGVKRTAGII
jgi:hypothetical protein